MEFHRFFILNAACLVAAVAATAAAAPVKIELPVETASFKTAPGAEIATGQCLMCHSAEYVTTQPPLSRAAWKATVEKMQNKYGAPLPPEQVDALVDYLTKSYGTPAAVLPAKAEADTRLR